MKYIINSFLILISVLTWGCSNDAWDDLPGDISDFITEYFPGSNVKSYTNAADGGHKVTIANGATLIFNKNNRWIEIDGEGVKLPEVLIYDQLPPALYDYLQSTEQQKSVFAMCRDKHFYKLTMLDTVITYNIDTGGITYPGESSVTPSSVSKTS